MSKKPENNIKKTTKTKSGALLFVGNALVVRSDKSNTSAEDGDIIAIYPLDRKLSAYEIVVFDICKISEECFSVDEIKKLERGQPLVYPYKTREYKVCCVKVSDSALKKGIIKNKMDLMEK